MEKAAYRNYDHYLKEGWHNQPKRYFQEMTDRIEELKMPTANLLDVGCATGNFLGYLHSRMPHLQLTGIDAMPELIQEGRALAPFATLSVASVLDLPSAMNDTFDIVTVLGVLSIFDEEEIARCFTNLLRVTRNNGHIYVFSPFNEFGVDSITRHRKRLNGDLHDWEVAWNIYSFETISDILDGRCHSFEFHPFNLGMSLERKLDPGRTWTIETESNPYQLINGLKLMVDLFFLEIVR